MNNQVIAPFLRKRWEHANNKVKALSSELFPQSSYLRIDQVLSNGVGRPSLSDSDVENDATATSKDAGNNTSDIKEFSVGIDGSSQYQTMQTYVQIPDDSDIEEFLRTPQCAMCGKDLESDEEYICDECLESYFAERLGDL